jgi:low temperature requirement protein LtrA
VRAVRSPPVPRLRLQQADDRNVERHATWTELFFDLVFVVCVAQLAAGLHDRPSLAGAAAFGGLFVPVWWTWTTYAYVADLFDADDAAFRAVLLGAMLLVAAQAATIPAAFDGRTVGFGVAYAILRVDLLAVYALAWWSDRGLRRLTGTHFGGFALGFAVWLGALAVPPPARYVLWGVSIAIDLATGLVAYLRRREVPRHSSHMPERFGLFVLIVLGESVIAVSVGTAQAHWALESVATAVVGFALAAALWWMYFARFDGEVFNWAFDGGPQARRRAFVFGYVHLPMLAALAAVGVGVKLAIEQAIARGESAIDEDFAFHHAIASATANPQFTGILQYLGRFIIPRQTVRVSAGAAEERRGYLETIQAEHRAIVDAVRTHAVQKARAAMRNHLLHSRKRYQKLAEKLGGE